MRPAPKNIDTGNAGELEHHIDGLVVQVGSHGYEDFRRALTRNGRPAERYPEFIVRPQAIDGVRHALHFARQQKLKVSPVGSGHSYSACFLHDGAMLIDLSKLNSVTVDRPNRQMKAEAGATAGRIDAELRPYDLAFPVGHGGTVGIAGFLLGGGIGINSGHWGGMSTYNILAADVMTADGRSHLASPNENQELFWALRGGGPGLPFIVTCFHLRCHERPRCVYLTNYFIRSSHLPDLASALDEGSASLDSRLQIMLAITPVPPEFETNCTASDNGLVGILTAIAYARTSGEAERLHESLAACIDPHWVLHREEHPSIAFTDIFAMTDALLTMPRVKADNIQTNQLAEAVAILLSHMPKRPSAASVPLIVWRNTTDGGNAAFSLTGRYSVSTYAQWEKLEDDASNATWLAALFDELMPIATGAYVNETDLERGARRAALCHSSDSRTRLNSIREKWDPEGIFHRVI